jgi:ABC-type multidrug transport system fused ATPase/permease subunit
VDRIYVLEKGRINQVGTHAVLIEEEGEYKNLFEKAALESFDLRKDNRPDIQAE